MTCGTCGTCAIAECEQAGLVETCERWTNTDEESEPSITTPVKVTSSISFSSTEFTDSLRKIAKFFAELTSHEESIEMWESEGGAL